MFANSGQRQRQSPTFATSEVVLDSLVLRAPVRLTALILRRIRVDTHRSACQDQAESVSIAGVPEDEAVVQGLVENAGGWRDRHQSRVLKSIDS